MSDEQLFVFSSVNQSQVPNHKKFLYRREIMLKVIPSEKCLNRNMRPILRNGRKRIVFDETDKVGNKKQKNLISYPLLIESNDRVLFGKNHSLMLDVIARKILFDYFIDYINAKNFFTLINRPCPIDIDDNGPHFLTLGYDDIRCIRQFQNKANVKARDFRKILTEISKNKISMDFTFRPVKNQYLQATIEGDQLFLLNEDAKNKCFNLIFQSDLGLLWFRNVVDLFLNYFPENYCFLNTRCLFLLKKYVVKLSRAYSPSNKLDEIYKYLRIETDNNKLSILKRCLEVLKSNAFINDYRISGNFISLDKRIFGYETL